MKGIALLGLLAMAPLTQAGTPFAGRDLTPPADFIMPAPGFVGVQVAPAPEPGKSYVGGRDLTPSAAFIDPSSGHIGVRVVPQVSAGGSPGHDAGSFGYFDDEGEGRED